MANEEHGSLSGGLRDPWDDAENTVEETDALTDALHDGVEAGGAMPGVGKTPLPAEAQPVNQASMECLRGPCIHMWSVVSRFETTVEGIRAKCTRTCTATGYADTPLQDANVYYCDRWWPRRTYLGKSRIADKKKTIPKGVNDPSLRGLYRDELRAAWEKALEADGYDFSWRDFDPVTMFTSDDEEQRKYSGIGGYAKAREAAAEKNLPPAAGVPEEDEETSDE